MGPPVVGGVPPSYARPPGSLLEKRDRLLVLASWHYLADVRRRSWARRRGAACSRWSGSLPDPTCRRTSTTTGSCGGATPITTCNGLCLSPASTWPPSRAGCWCMGSTRSEEHTSELQSLMRSSYAVFCLKKKNIILCITYNTIRLRG